MRNHLLINGNEMWYGYEAPEESVRKAIYEALKG